MASTYTHSVTLPFLQDEKVVSGGHEPVVSLRSTDRLIADVPPARQNRIA